MSLVVWYDSHPKQQEEKVLSTIACRPNLVAAALPYDVQVGMERAWRIPDHPRFLVF